MSIFLSICFFVFLILATTSLSRIQPGFSLFSGQNSDMLISTLIKHLDHKNIGKQLIIQINIINVARHLMQQAKFQASLSILASINDLIRHLRKCLQYSIESSNMGDDDGEKWNSVLHFALEECLIQLANKVLSASNFIDEF